MFFVALAALLLLGSATLENSTAPSAAHARPTLAVASVTPLRVTGAGFKPNERVRVSAESDRKNAKAGARGRFSVAFAGIDACGGIVVTAVGNKGSRASIAFNATWRVLCVEP